MMNAGLGNSKERTASDTEEIEGILDSKIEVRDPENPTAKITKISYGRKDLTLNFRPEIAVSGGSLLTTYIENIRPEDSREERETTLLYSAARQMMQDLANEKGKPVSYIFDTENKTLLEWARTAGREIFGWDAEEVKSEESGKGVFTKLFFPQKAKTSR